jgi:hypothetical protein
MPDNSSIRYADQHLPKKSSKVVSLGTPLFARSLKRNFEAWTVSVPPLPSLLPHFFGFTSAW